MVGKGETVAIIGGGNTAIDAARTAIKQGGKVTVIYRRTEKELPAYDDEIEDAKKEGVNFKFLLSPTGFTGNPELEKAYFAEMQLSSIDETDRKRPIPTGTIVEHEFGKVIIAIGQNQCLDWLEKDGIKTINGYRIKANSRYQTSLEKVYAAGDCVTGAKTIANATKTALGAAGCIAVEGGRK